MLLGKACGRCKGDMSRVSDVGEVYYSCLQCGFVSYQHPSQVATGAPKAGPTPRPKPVDRALVRRRQLRRRAA